MTYKYGVTYKLDDPSKNGIGASATLDGTIIYPEICQRVKTGSLTEKYDSGSRVPYAFNGAEWVGYESVKSIKEKGNFIYNNFLGGAGIQALDADDYSNKCGDGNSYS